MENFHAAASQLYVNTRKRISEKNQDIDKYSIPIPFIVYKRYLYAFCIILHFAQWNEKSKIIIRPCFNLSSSRSSKFLLILLCTNKNLDPNERKKKKKKEITTGRDWRPHWWVSVLPHPPLHIARSTITYTLRAVVGHIKNEERERRRWFARRNSCTAPWPVRARTAMRRLFF